MEVKNILIIGTLLLVFLCLDAANAQVIINITSLTEGQTLNDSTPTLNITVSPAAQLWYNLDNEPVNYTLCSSCTSVAINISEENQDDHGTEYTKLLMHLDCDAIDESGYGNDGQVYEAKFVDGKFNQALEFDGYNDYVKIPDSSSLNITREITIEAWIKPNSMPYNFKQILRKEGSYVLEITSDNKPQFNICNNGDWSNAAMGTTVLHSDTWYHLAGTYSLGELKVYLNGVADGNSSRCCLGIDSSTNNVLMGVAKSNHLPFNGTIDEVRVMNKSLSGNEIRSDYGLDNGSHAVTVYAEANNITVNLTRSFNIELTTSTTSTSTTSTTSSTSTSTTSTSTTSTSTTSTTSTSTTSTSTTSTTSTSTTSTSTTSTTSTSTTTVSTSTTTTVSVQCPIGGDTPPCGEVTLDEVVNYIALWNQGGAELEDVMNLISIWISG